MYNQVHPPQFYSQGKTLSILDSKGPNHKFIPYQFYSQGQIHPIDSVVRTIIRRSPLTNSILRAKQSYDKKSVSYDHKSATLPPNHGESSFFSSQKKTVSIKNCCTMITVIIFLILTTITMITMITINSVGSTSGQQAGAVRRNEGCKR